MNKDRIISELNLRLYGSKGWMRSDDVECIFGCDRSDKFGILFTNNGAIVKCMRCGESTSLYNYLKNTNRSHLIERNTVSVKDEIKSLDEDIEEKEQVEQQEIEKPRGFKRIYFDEYLDQRGFTEPKIFKILCSKEFISIHI